MTDLGPITPNMVPVTVYVLFNGEHYLRETANGAGMVSHDREWVPVEDPTEASKYWSKAGAEWAAARCGGLITELIKWVDEDEGDVEMDCPSCDAVAGEWCPHL